MGSCGSSGVSKRGRWVPLVLFGVSKRGRWVLLGSVRVDGFSGSSEVSKGGYVGSCGSSGVSKGG